ncbi:MAG: type I DNA topoisomerase, partial [Pseudomonadota bacterium]
MSRSNLVIVESPAKAKTIEKYLGGDYRVLASYGHIRDLPAKDGSVNPDDDFSMLWELDSGAKKRLDEIAKAANDAERIFLATDPDREGEAISWHVQEVLAGERGVDRPFRRITFNEITKRAVLDALDEARDLDHRLINAYLARRALDYLVGFTISPVLWRKLPGSRSAGRVQSVALRLICEREAAIEVFRPQEYWTIDVTLDPGKGEKPFAARLTHLDGSKLDKFSLGDEASAKSAVEKLTGMNFQVADVQRKQARRNPFPPFTTSTLQQEASRKLRMSATQTMRTAQRLYEGFNIDGETVGLITYMRTDGLQLSQEAIEGTRNVIQNEFGADYLPSSPRLYKSTAKNAQEAHEAIRPTDLSRRPADVGKYLDEGQRKLYELIWKRTVACQMAPALLDQVAVTVDGDKAGTAAELRATGSVVRFPGFLKVYDEDQDDDGNSDDEKSERRLPAVDPGQALTGGKIADEQHFTQPPPRFSEASLVKEMEQLGIGRPSTYASILQVLQDRDYVRLEKRRFIPEDRGRLVTAFLENYFGRYVEYDFTAQLEGQLDEISGGRADWRDVLRDFWERFSQAVDETKDLRISEVIDALDEELGPHFFPARSDGTDSRICPACTGGGLGLRLSRNGAFMGCSNYPDCRFTRPLGIITDEVLQEAAAYPRNLGPDPTTGEVVSIRKGPYGFYAQRGEAAEGVKPARMSLPKTYDPAIIDLATAVDLLNLPRTIGLHPDAREDITASIGRYGPYLKVGDKYKNLPADEDVLTIGMNRAVELLADAKSRPTSAPLKALGDHPDDGKPVEIMSGRYG